MLGTMFDEDRDTLDGMEMEKETVKKEAATPSKNGHETGYNGYRVISNCPQCAGAVFPYSSWVLFDSEKKKLYQCFHCGRLYIKNTEGAFELWVKPFPKALRLE